MEIKTNDRELRDALVRAFESFGYHVTDWEVWCGIHTNFADRVIKAINNITLEKVGTLKREPDYPRSRFKKVFGKFYVLK